MITQSIKLSAKAYKSAPIISMMQSDTGRTLQCTFDDFEIPKGATASLYIHRPNDTFYEETARISGQTITIDADQIITTAGYVNCNLKIEKNGEMIQSFPFTIRAVSTSAGSPQTEEKGVTLLGLDERVTALEESGLALHTYHETEVPGGYYDAVIGGEETNSLHIASPVILEDEAEFEGSLTAKSFISRVEDENHNVVAEITSGTQGAEMTSGNIGSVKVYDDDVYINSYTADISANSDIVLDVTGASSINLTNRVQISGHDGIKLLPNEGTVTIGNNNVATEDWVSTQISNAVTSVINTPI